MVMFWVGVLRVKCLVFASLCGYGYAALSVVCLYSIGCDGQFDNCYKEICLLSISGMQKLLA